MSKVKEMARLYELAVTFTARYQRTRLMVDKQSAESALKLARELLAGMGVSFDETEDRGPEAGDDPSDSGLKPSCGRCCDR